MFEKLVSNLPFSPALVGQVGFYARRLKREETTRRLGLIFTALALIVQSFAVFAPPESANASNPGDMIPGGVTTLQQVIAAYDASARGNGDYEDILTYAGITREELVSAHAATINSKDYGKGDGAWLTWGRVHRFSAAEGEVKHEIPIVPKGGTTTIYSKPLWLYDSTSWTIPHGSTYDAYVGYSQKIGVFAVMKGCGNIVTRRIPTAPPLGYFIQASCTIIGGIAYDGRNRGASVDVYLYIGGPPGTGDKIGPLHTDAQTNHFVYNIPDKYLKATTPTKVWGVMVPLPGWPDQTVQFRNNATIPANCIDAGQPPSARCTNLDSQLISRTQRSLTAQAETAGGATIKGYDFVVKDKNGKVVFEKNVPTSADKASSGIFDLKDDGDYTATVTVSTSLGSRTSADCTKTITVAPPAACQWHPSIPRTDKDCAPCPGDSNIWIKSPDCKPEVVESKTAQNLTQQVEASSATAKPGDRIQYTIYLENNGKAPATTPITESLADVLEYSALEDNGGGTFDTATNTLTWSNVTLKPGEKTSRTFVVQVDSPIPATPVGTSEPSSYDCIMTNAFGNSVSIRVDCSAPKEVEQVITQLPSTGPTENMLFAGGLLSIVVFFWARARQLGKEVRLVRKDFNSGTI